MLTGGAVAVMEVTGFRASMSGGAEAGMNETSSLKGNAGL
jgi:hypothetical protein